MHLLHRHHPRIAATRGRASARAVKTTVPLPLPPPPPSSSARLCSSSSSKRRTTLLLIARATPNDDDEDADPDADDAEDIGPPPLPPPASPAALDAAALAAVDAFVKPGAVVGLGRGELVQRVVAAIGRRISEGKLGNVSVVPSAAASAASAAFHGVKIAAAADNADPTTPAPSPTVFFDEADQLDPQANAYLSGSRAGEAAHPDLPAICSLVERTLARGGEVVALPASAAACVPRLNAALPVALAGAGGGTTTSSDDNNSRDPSQAPLAAWEEAAEELDDIFLGDAELWRRPQDPRESANPRGGRAPLVQPDGSTLVDIRFYEGLCLFGEGDVDYERIQEEITSVSGVIATGLFVNKSTAAVVPSSAGAAEGDGAIKPRMLVRGEGGALIEGAGAAAV